MVKSINEEIDRWEERRKLTERPWPLKCSIPSVLAPRCGSEGLSGSIREPLPFS